MISFSVKQMRNFYKRTRTYFVDWFDWFLGGGFFIGCLGFGNRFVHCFLSFGSNVRSLRFGGIFFHLFLWVWGVDLLVLIQGDLCSPGWPRTAVSTSLAWALPFSPLSFLSAQVMVMCYSSLLQICWVDFFTLVSKEVYFCICPFVWIIGVT